MSPLMHGALHGARDEVIHIAPRFSHLWGELISQSHLYAQE